jgi:hypothetical protein
VNRTTTFVARTAAGLGKTFTVTVHSVVKISVKAMGKGKVKVVVYGAPSVKGTAWVYSGSSTKPLASKATNDMGDAAWIVSSKRGARLTLKGKFQAPGTVASAVVSAKTIRVL